MTEEEKILKMLLDIHGVLPNRFTTEFVRDEEKEKILGVNLMRDGEFYHYMTKADLLFSYITRKWYEDN